MTKKKEYKKPEENIEVQEPKEVSKNWQSFKVKKQFPTMDADGKIVTYQVNEIFKHYDKRVINFLKQQKII